MADILIIDDDVNLVGVLRGYLEGQGYLVNTANDGNRGLQEFISHGPDLILLDILMPKMDGWDTLKRIRDVSEVPVVLMSGLSEEPDILRGFSMGADDYVIKPFSFAQMEARVKAILKRVCLQENNKPKNLEA